MLFTTKILKNFNEKWTDPKLTSILSKTLKEYSILLFLSLNFLAEGYNKVPRKSSMKFAPATVPTSSVSDNLRNNSRSLFKNSVIKSKIRK